PRDLAHAGLPVQVARAADASLADASRAGALATAAILAGGLLLSLRLRPSRAFRSSRTVRADGADGDGGGDGVAPARLAGPVGTAASE
ncbi:hypothetical protein AB0J52_27460, partial [Spirillospora sp. NPDC049652]